MKMKIKMTSIILRENFAAMMIIFDVPHIYTINGDNGFTSVTTWNHSHFEKFDADKIIERMMSSNDGRANTLKDCEEPKQFGMQIVIRGGWNCHN